MQLLESLIKSNLIKSNTLTISLFILLEVITQLIFLIVSLKFLIFLINHPEIPNIAAITTYQQYVIVKIAPHAFYN